MSQLPERDKRAIPLSSTPCHSEQSEESCCYASERSFAFLRKTEKIEDHSSSKKSASQACPPVNSPVKFLLEEALAGFATVAILGCGSPLRGDDAAGSLIATNLADLDALSNGKARAYYGEVAPENQTGPIKEFNPELLVIIDAVDMSCEPGEVRIIPSNAVGGVSFSTHILPLPILMQYLEGEIGCRTLLLGIQVANLEFMAEMTPAVADAVDAITSALRELLA